uniref:Uncharacterized protein n=1 Tax=Amphimedon queenslandica TaxID=400682 RepID=A0A1X7SXW2_AMPQE
MEGTENNEDMSYMSLAPIQSQEHHYEMLNMNINNARKDHDAAAPSTEVPIQNKVSKQSTWSTPLVVIAGLLCLMVLLLVVILCLSLVLLSAKDDNGVVSKVNKTLPDFDQWANGVVSKVNKTLPDFDQWANGVVSKVNKTLPDFDEWANGVVSKVNKTLPDFDEWANGVVSKVNKTLPDFDRWANGVASKVNKTLPDFDEWANGVAQYTAQLLQNSSNFTEINAKILQTTTDSAQKLINIVNTLSNLQDTSTSTAGVVDDILLIAQELLVPHNDSTALPTSCKKIKEAQPSSSSGMHLVVNTSSIYSVYCDMEELCGSGGGGQE